MPTSRLSGTRRQKIIKTADTLRMVHAGLAHPSERINNCAESVLSVLILNLRHPEIVLPESVVDVYLTLADNT